MNFKKGVPWGHAQVYQRDKWAFGFFIIQICPYFQFNSGWYRNGEVRGIVARYYWVVRSVLKERPHLKKCLTRCRHCHILFFTHPCNAGRRDLGCPFGCREAQRRKNSTQRSTEYYRSKEGKIKKRYLNSKRSQSNRLPESSRGENGIDNATVYHIRMVTSLIEGRDVGLAEIYAMLCKILRQPSIDMDGKLTYVAFGLQKTPP